MTKKLEQIPEKITTSKTRREIISADISFWQKEILLLVLQKAPVLVSTIEKETGIHKQKLADNIYELILEGYIQKAVSK